MSCELGSKETTGPTGGSQHREYWGGPTNGRAAACRRRLAAVELATLLHREGGGFFLVQGFHRARPPCLLQLLRKIRATSAAVDCNCASALPYSFSSPRGIPGHLDRPRHSRPGPSLPLHRHYLRRCHCHSPAAHPAGVPAPRRRHRQPLFPLSLCASSVLGCYPSTLCSHPDPSLPLTSCCSKLPSWRLLMGDSQALGRLLFQPG